MDTKATVEQSKALFDAGAELVRITTPGPKDAENLRHIKSALLKQGYKQPLIADIHFSPKAALIALEHVEKVRINPGNFVDRKFSELKKSEYTESQYQEELGKIKEVFLPFVRRAKELKRSIRIGSNHGSLSDRIMNRYGDTPLGMLESVLEFIRFARQENFHNIIVSMKSSNPQIMIQAYRLLADYFIKHNYDYPIHLGLTEAGSGTDGRMKSSIGITSLLLNGIGDTIRVSLTEDPVKEISAANNILNCIKKIKGTQEIKNKSFFPFMALKEKNKQIDAPLYQYKRLASAETILSKENKKMAMGAKNLHRVFLNIDQKESKALEKICLSQEDYKKQLTILSDNGCDVLYLEPDLNKSLIDAITALKIPWVQNIGYLNTNKEISITINDDADGVSLDLVISKTPSLDLIKELIQLEHRLKEKKQQLYLNLIFESDKFENCLSKCFHAFKKEALFLKTNIVISLSLHNTKDKEFNFAFENLLAYRWLYFNKETFFEKGIVPSLLLRSQHSNLEQALYETSLALGGLLIDGFGDGLLIKIDKSLSSSPTKLSLEEKLKFHLDLLQATRLRSHKTEYISCPSCGRTLFDLEETTKRIHNRTGKLKNVKIAIMGCIVNGPGEMADADYGYVGAGPGKVNLYRQNILVKKNIPTDIADEELFQLIQKDR